MISLINTRQLITNQQIKTTFTNGIILTILTIIRWKFSINLLINLQKRFTVYEHHELCQNEFLILFLQLTGDNKLTDGNTRFSLL